MHPMNREEAMNDLDIDERTAMLEETLEHITEAAALVKSLHDAALDAYVLALRGSAAG